MTEDETKRLNELKQKIKDGSHFVEYIDQEDIEFLLNLIDKQNKEMTDAIAFAEDIISKISPYSENKDYIPGFILAVVENLKGTEQRERSQEELVKLFEDHIKAMNDE